MIDGKLDDWDLSGQVLMCYDIESLKDVYSKRVTMMYDADWRALPLFETPAHRLEAGDLLGARISSGENVFI